MAGQGERLKGLRYRTRVRPADREAVRELVATAGVFSDAEVAIALELVEARLAQGARSGYAFLFAELPGAAADLVVGYACFGPIPATVASYDLYWLVVRPAYRGLGLGTALLARSEAWVRRRGGKRLYVETSSRPAYAPTRAFYCARGYREVAVLPDYYAPGDAKVIYVKLLSSQAAC
ncbi:MAG: hypothetical protein KatS3mg131_1464 [Candidatus Tectimicrobiota bacterium]|nr:MAG: hypothetical protein KatS3mg131_1464 [Candidatus Tectomicrobia bacterium]